MSKANIPWSTPEIGAEELESIVDSFKADWLTMGPKVKEFERLMAAYVGAPFAIAVNNGTSALDLIWKTLGIQPGDEIICPSMTYIATAASISYQNAVPVFVDIEERSYNLDPEKIEAAISSRTRAIVFIDYGGNPADVEAIKSVASKHNLHCVQDAAQSLGAVYQGANMGAQTEVSSMSFHMAKVMAAVEGGMIFTHNEEYCNEIKIRRNQGESAKYMHSHLGTNARMTDITAAIAIEQFKKLPRLLAERKRVAQMYDELFARVPGVTTMPCLREGSQHAHFFYPILLDRRDDIADRLRSEGIDTRIAYPMPVFEQEVYREGRCACRALPSPVAKKFTEQVLNLPIFPAMTTAQTARVVDLIESYLRS